MKIFLQIIILLALTTVSLSGQTPDTVKILHDVDQLGNFDDIDFAAVYTIVAEKPGQARDVTEVTLYRRDRLDQFVMIINKPEAQKGQGYLQVDENIWFYDPESREFEHSSMSSNIQNSDAKNSDLARGSLSDDYSVESWENGKVGIYPVWILHLKAKNDDVSYDRMDLYVRQDITIVLAASEFGFSGNLMRTTIYQDYQQVGPKILPQKILVIDNVNVGEKSEITMKQYSTKTLDDSIFSKQFLEFKNK